MATTTELDMYLKSLGIPIAGVRRAGGVFVVDYLNIATQQQRDTGNAVAAGWDADTESGNTKLLRRLAQTLLDEQREMYLLLRAVVIESLGYTNDKLTIIANTLQTKGVITLAERNNFVNNLATPAQARTAIKNRINAGEADN
jgi:hypothetical protein